MKKIILLWACFLVSITLLGQPLSDKKRDYQWLAGYYYYQWGNLLDFNKSPLQINNYKKKVDFRETNVSICDKNGQLLFFY